MDITEILEKSGINISDDKIEDFNKEFRKAYKSVREVEKLRNKIDELESNVFSLTEEKEQLSREKAETVTSNISEWEEKYKNLQKESEEKLRGMELKHAIENKINGINFTSSSAREYVINKALTSEIKYEEGNLSGFEEFLNSIKDSDPNAFITQDTEQKAMFTREIGSNGQEININPETCSMDEYRQWRKSI